MNESQRLLGALGMCRKAGKLVRGFDAVEESVMKGKAWLVLMAADLSPKTAARVQDFCEDLVPCVTMPLTQSDLLDVAHKPTGVFAVADENFAKLCEKHLVKKEDNIE